MNGAINDVSALEACIGKTPGAMPLKIIDHLDDGAQRWIVASPLCFIAFGDDAGIAITLGGGEPGFAEPLDATRLRLRTASLDEPQLARVGQGVGALFVAHGIGETLRVNGRVIALSEDAVEIEVRECYVHCAKALIRSEFWGSLPRSDAPDDVTVFLAASRFMALATIDAQGRADVSPKGDPAGALIQLDKHGAWYSERPGNRLADSYRNMLTQPQVSAAALIPGSTHIALISGVAGITADTAMRERFVVAGKTPLLATCIERPQLVLRHSDALARAGLWPTVKRAESINPAAVMTGHIKLNKIGGLQAALLRKAVSVPGLMQHGLRHDYKHNLY